MPAQYQIDFVNTYYPYALDVSRQTGIHPAVVLGHTAMETGWGRHAPGNNFFGIKGPGGSYETQEFINGQWITITDSFRGYASPADSFQDYADFINRYSRYEAYRTAGSIDEQLRALSVSGYGTAPNYYEGVSGTTRTVENILADNGMVTYGPLGILRQIGDPIQWITNLFGGLGQAAEDTLFNMHPLNDFGPGKIEVDAEGFLSRGLYVIIGLIFLSMGLVALIVGGKAKTIIATAGKAAVAGSIV